MQKIFVEPRAKSTHRSVTFNRFLYAVLEEESKRKQKPLSQVVNDLLMASDIELRVQNKILQEQTKYS